MPGRSTTETLSPDDSREPLFFSTVTPGQFPVRWLEPVRALKSVVFPELGFPAMARTGAFFSARNNFV